MAASSSIESTLCAVVVSLVVGAAQLKAEPPTAPGENPRSAAGPSQPKALTAVEQQRLDEANKLNNRVVELYKQSKFREALPLAMQVLAVRQEILGNKHPSTAVALHNVSSQLHGVGDFAGARPYAEQALAICKQVRGDKHPDTARSLGHVGFLLSSQGDYAAAQRYFEQALSIYKQVLGDKHLDTARLLNNLGFVLQAQGDYAAARPYLEQALSIHREILGDKHPFTAKSLNNLAPLLQAQGDYVAAKMYYEQALAIRKEVLGDKHRDTAVSLNCLGFLLLVQGEYAAARPYHEQSLAILKEVLGENHPDTVVSLNNMGHVVARLNDWDAAATLFAEAVDIQNTLRDAMFATTTEAEALNYAAAELHTQDAMITAWRHTGRSADTLYGQLWPGRAALFQIVSNRPRRSGALATPEVQSLYQAWLDSRREVARLTLAPPDPDIKRQAARRQRLVAASQRKEQQERELALALPDVARERNLLRRPHTDLQQALPAEVVFVDLLRYASFEYDPQIPAGKGFSSAPNYVAFVLTSNQKIARVDLGLAAPIDAAAVAWRKAILAGTPDSSADQLRQLVWQPISEMFPAGARTVYLVPGGVLASLPWSALPGKRPSTVLLEEFALAVVPNGQVLLDQLLSAAPAEGKGTVLAIGGVQYDLSPVESKGGPNLAALRAAPLDSKSRLHWPDLPGTLAEVEEAKRLAGQRLAVTLSRDEASTARVLEELPGARWATLATHGFFADAAFRSALQLDERDFERRQAGMSGERTTVAGRNPLLLSGLVFAGANLPRLQDEWGVPQGDGGILTAEAIAGLDLSRMELAVLSACETGLGDVAGGEGVFGLQRAFHQAGCRNVVASLWKIDDQATSALMRLFYYKLWQENKAPLVALREAQLAIYRHPDQTVQLATTRGPDFAKTVKLVDDRQKQPTSQTSDIRKWAAFTLSGTGK